MGQGIDWGESGVLRMSHHCLNQAIPISLGYILYSEPALAIIFYKEPSFPIHAQ